MGFTRGIIRFICPTIHPAIHTPHSLHTTRRTPQDIITLYLLLPNQREDGFAMLNKREKHFSHMKTLDQLHETHACLCLLFVPVQTFKAMTGPIRLGFWMRCLSTPPRTNLQCLALHSFLILCWFALSLFVCVCRGATSPPSKKRTTTLCRPRNTSTLRHERESPAGRHTRTYIRTYMGKWVLE